MRLDELVAALEREGHVCRRDADGKPRTWIEPGRGAVITVNGTPMLQSEAELLLRHPSSA